MELKELLDIERQGWDALCDSTGASFYGELMTDDALMILANGMVLDRAGVVESLRAAPPWRAYEIQDPRLVDVGADSKVLVYLGVGYRDTAEPAFRGVMSSTYVLTAGGWRLACYQQTQLAQ